MAFMIRKPVTSKTTYYHGTVAYSQDIENKNTFNILLPADRTGNLREVHRKKLLDCVFITSSFHSAKKYAFKAFHQFQLRFQLTSCFHLDGLDGGHVVVPVVYTVRPDQHSLSQINPLGCPTEYVCHFAHVESYIVLATS